MRPPTPRARAAIAPRAANARPVTFARLAAIAPLVAIACLTGCSDATTRFCTTDVKYALRIALADSLTGQIGPFRNLAIVAVDGSYKDSLFIPTVGPTPNPNLYSVAPEHAGTFTLTVRADGYQTWTKSGIVVLRDECHVESVDLPVRLAPQ